MSKITFELDGKTVEAAEGETIWQVAKRSGTTIPHLCYHDAPGYRADGNCRACVVEVEGERVLAASCIRTPTPGMKVKTASERATKGRAMVFELLVADQPKPADAHDDKSKFWTWVSAMGVSTTSRLPAADAKPASDTTHSAISVNLDACINCGLCVRACREVQANDVIGMAYRGHGSKVVFDFDPRHGPVDLRRLWRVRAGLSDRRADGIETARSGHADKRRSRPIAASIRYAPIAASAAKPRFTSRAKRSSPSMAAMARPTTTGCASRAASASTISIIPTALPSR